MERGGHAGQKGARNEASTTNSVVLGKECKNTLQRATKSRSLDLNNLAITVSNVCLERAVSLTDKGRK